MSPIFLRSRLLVTLLRKQNRRLLSSDCASSHFREPLVAAQTVVADQPPPPTSPDSNRSSSKAWKFFKYTLIGALTGAAAATGYVSYGMWYIWFTSAGVNIESFDFFLFF